MLSKQPRCKPSRHSPPSAPRAAPAELLSPLTSAAPFKPSLFTSVLRKLQTCELKQVFLCQQPHLRVVLC